MIANTEARDFDVIEVTNEMPPNRIGGVGTVVENLLSGFAAIGVRTLWFLVDHGYQPFEIDRMLSEYPCGAIGTPEELKRFAAPITHLHSYHHNPDLIGALNGTRTVFTIHSLLVQEERSNDVKLTSAVGWQEGLIAACNQVVLVSDAERRHYHALGYDRLNPRVRVVHNGLREVAPVPARAPSRVLGFCGRLVPRKHPEYVQMILREPGFENHRTMIAGKAFSRYARDLLREWDIEDRVDYLGWCGGARLEAFYAAIDVLAIPSVYEPFCMAALEAVARGIPVVCTRIDGLAEVLGDSAFFCESDSYADFRAAMLRWAAAPQAQLLELTRAARLRYQSRFTDIAMAQNYRRLFEEVARL